jgi:hypothetical protein
MVDKSERLTLHLAESSKAIRVPTRLETVRVFRALHLTFLNPSPARHSRHPLSE